jgi:hypothetical protein
MLRQILDQMAATLQKLLTLSRERILKRFAWVSKTTAA